MFDTIPGGSVTKDAFLPYVFARQPVLIRGGATSMPAYTKWTPEYIADKFGDQQFTVADISYSKTFGQYWYSPAPPPLFFCD